MDQPRGLPFSLDLQPPERIDEAGQVELPEPPTLVQALASPAVASCPERTNRTGGALVVNAFVMGHPMIRSAMTTDLAPASVMNASTSSATRISSRMSVWSFESQRRRSVAPGVLGRHDADRELSRRAIVRTVERDRCERPAAKSFLGPLAQSFAGALDHRRQPLA